MIKGCVFQERWMENVTVHRAFIWIYYFNKTRQNSDENFFKPCVILVSSLFGVWQISVLHAWRLSFSVHLYQKHKYRKCSCNLSFRHDPSLHNDEGDKTWKWPYKALLEQIKKYLFLKCFMLENLRIPLFSNKSFTKTCTVSCHTWWHNVMFVLS